MWNCTTGEHCSFRLPSASIRDFIVVGDEVVISLGTSLSFIIWDMKTRRTRSCDMKSRPLMMIPLPSEDSLAAIHINRICGNVSCDDHACPVTGVTVTKYSFNGAGVACQQPSTLLNLPRGRTWIIKGPVYPICSSICCRTVIIPLRSTLETSNSCPISSNTHYAFIAYNSRADKASLRIYDGEVGGPPPQSELSVEPILMSHNLMYYINDGGEQQEIWIFNPDGPLVHRKSEITEVEGSPGSSRIRDAAAPAAGPRYAISRQTHQRCFPFGDSDFFGLATASGLEVWCFDEGVHMAADVPYYRQARRHRARIRAQARSVTPPTEELLE